MARAPDRHHAFRMARMSLATLTIGWALSAASPALSDQFLTPEQSDEEALRMELADIIENRPEYVGAAERIRQELDQPANTAEGRQLRNRRERGARRIVNGTATMRHAAVAAILQGTEPSSARVSCTGTLVGCNKVLSAAHCFRSDPRPSNYSVFLSSAGFRKVSRIDIPKHTISDETGDLALLTLDGSVEGITPVAVSAVASPLAGSQGTIVGFGRSGGHRFDYGIKREGSVRFKKCSGTPVDRTGLCWNYDADIQVRLKEANTCNVDSGGGVFVVDRVGQSKVPVLVGVVRGGRDVNCEQDDHSFNTDVFAWRDWIREAAGGGLAAAACGSVTRLYRDARSTSRTVALTKSGEDVSLPLSVPKKTASLRVALHGEDDGTGRNDFDLSVAPTGSGKTRGCNQAGNGQFGYCEIDSPQDGAWAVSLRSKKGRGLAQVIVTLLPEPE
ncbi:MAG: S1 family peptidase [Hyphomicrobium sp.]